MRERRDICWGRGLGPAVADPRLETIECRPAAPLSPGAAWAVTVLTRALCCWVATAWRAAVNVLQANKRHDLSSRAGYSNQDSDMHNMHSKQQRLALASSHNMISQTYSSRFFAFLVTRRRMDAPMRSLASDDGKQGKQLSPLMNYHTWA
jgi:hypothetical protein